MHRVELPEAVIARVTARRGRRHAFPALDPRRTALVVIDMQNAFLQAGSPGEVAPARDIVPAINRLAVAVRHAGGRVAWVSMTVDPGTPGAGWPVFFGEIFPAELAGRYIQALAPDAEGHRLWPALQAEPGDLRARKTRFSAFLPGACDLPEQLARHGLDTVIIAGTLTNVCCESSARDAMMRGYRVIMASDANATRSDEDHLASLIAVYQTFGDVRTTAELEGLLARPGAAA